MEHCTITQPVAGRYELTADEGYLLRVRGTDKTMKTAVAARLADWEVVADESKPKAAKRTNSKRKQK